MGMLRKFLGKIPTGLLSGITVIIILWLTLAPHPLGDQEMELFPGADKVIHAVMFGFLTFIVLLETMKHRKWTLLPLALIGLITIICALFGIGIEVVQRAMGLGRTFEVLDILADTAGAFGIAGIWAAIQKTFALPQ